MIPAPVYVQLASSASSAMSMVEGIRAAYEYQPLTATTLERLRAAIAHVRSDAEVRRVERESLDHAEALALGYAAQFQMMKEFATIKEEQREVARIQGRIRYTD